MKRRGWLERLRADLPGWYVWATGYGRQWHAVPLAGGWRVGRAPRGAPGRIDAPSPIVLRSLVRQKERDNPTPPC